MNSTPATLLIVDDDTILCKSLQAILKQEGYRALAFPNGNEALAYLRENEADVLIVDLMMPGMTGLEFLEQARRLRPDAEFIMQTGHGSIESAVQAMKHGAYDFVVKPIAKVELLKVIARALEKRRLSQEIHSLKRRLDYYENFSKVVGQSKEIRDVLALVEQVAPSEATVLITGESGTGKEVIATALHKLSPRKSGPFIKVNCAALTETLLESELFGHEKGAFTGATERRIGRFEAADGGSLFLDEIGEIPQPLQVKLLRFLQEREFERVGSTQTLKSNVRVITATHRDLEELIQEKKFREDLYYRLRVIEMRLPPLRDRREDIPLFVHHFIDVYAAKNGKSISGIDSAALQALTDYAWPGNVRELENAIERAVVLTSAGSGIGLSALPPHIFKSRPAAAAAVNGDHMLIPFNLPLSEVEHLVCQKTLQHHNGNKQQAAQALGLSERTLYRKLETKGE